MEGKFIISLDLELYWGVFDQRSIESYEENLLNVRPVITRMLELADKHEISLTFSTVGFLFAESKKEILEHLPLKRPTYVNKELSPYLLLNSIGNTENEDPFYYGKSIIKKIVENGNHEIGTHTFSHYYCHEPGQTIDHFEHDLKSAVSIAKSNDIKIESIVFPRNMIDPRLELDRQYLDICSSNGIKSFRGNEESIIYNSNNHKFYSNWYIIRLLRIIDTYINISGYHTYSLKNLKSYSKVLHLPSSRLLRSYSKNFSLLETLKLRRIKKAMKYAALNGELYHLWWHPHNFGTNTKENFKNLEVIFNEYSKLNKDYGFQSMTMTELTEYINSKD